ncbi:MAG: alpha/beta hydrolase [Salibacteraceae bacterium]
MGKPIVKKLILISDISGLANSKWMNQYSDILSKEFEVSSVCSLKLAKINPLESKETIHKQFINGGIEKAVQELLSLNLEKTTIIAFSIGGAIAWRAALEGVKVDSLYAVSSTRLRNETQKPNCQLKLIYGEKDPNKPTDEWYQKIELIPKIIPGEEHELYKNSDFIKQFASQVNWASGLIY